MIATDSFTPLASAYYPSRMYKIDVRGVADLPEKVYGRNLRGQMAKWREGKIKTKLSCLDLSALAD